MGQDMKMPHAGADARGGAPSKGTRAKLGKRGVDVLVKRAGRELEPGRRYVDDREKRGRAAKTIAEYRKLVDGLEDTSDDALVIARTWIGKTETDCLTREDVKLFHTEQSKRPTLANRAVALIAAAY